MSREESSSSHQQPDQAPQALAGLRVLEIADLVAGPYCGKLLAALGADVVKVETPPQGDPSRRSGPFPGDVPHPERSGAYLYLNTGKRGVTLNLSDAQGRALLAELVRQSDVVTHDKQQGQAEELGLHPDALLQANPNLVAAVLTPYGSDGPYAGYRAYDINVFHAGGEGYLLPNGLALDTFPDRAPIVAGGQMGSYQAGLTAAVGVVAAVYARMNGAPGQAVDSSAQQAQLFVGYVPIQRLEAEGLVEDRFARFFRVGGVLPARDGYVELLTLERRQWDNLVHFLGNPEWATPEKFQEPARYGPEINQRLREWFAQHPREWLYHEEQAHGVPIAPYYSPAEVFHSPQQRERDFYLSVDHPEAGAYDYAGLPFHLSETPERTTRAPLLGEHNRQVYASLGYSPEDIVSLARSGVI